MTELDQGIPDHNILIATPAYNGNIQTEYLHAVLAFQKAGINFEIETTRSESLITRARNLLLTHFWRREEYTHILFLDADVFLDPHGLLNMLYFEKDVIGAPVSLKGVGKDGKRVFNTDANLEYEIKLQSVSWLGTAVFMLSRNAVAALVTDAREREAVYPRRSVNLVQDNPEMIYDVFQVGVVDGEYLSEDFWVCNKLRSLGFDVFVDTSIYTRHTGMVVFDT